MRLIRKIILSLSSLINKIYNYMILKLKHVDYGNLSIRGKIVLCGKGKIVLGEHVIINSSLRSNPIGGQTFSLFSVEKGAKLEIGSDTGVSNITIVCRKHIMIGKKVKIGGNTKIYDTDFHNLDYEKRLNHETDIPLSEPIIIKDGAFIGAHSIILKGVTIGEKSIVGAGSIVTKNIPDGEIWAGNPAKFIRKT